MPKTTRKFDWEIYTTDGDFLDILSMTRKEMKTYQENNPDKVVKELGYTDDGRNDSCEVDSQERRNVYSVRIPRR